MSSPLFKCKTDNAFRVKIMSEITSNVLKTGFWEIGPDGIILSMFDESRKTMLTISMDSENFQMYNFESEDAINIGINSSHLHKMLKSVKKKDMLELQIDSDDSDELTITTIPSIQNRKTVSKIKIQTVQNIDVVNPGGYGRSIIIPSSDFQKMIKDLNTISSDKLEISSQNGVISFTADADGVMKRTVTFGEENERLGSSSSEKFSMEQIQRISKISALSESIHVFVGNDSLPIQIKTKIGDLGVMCIYIKSDSILNNESD